MKIVLRNNKISDIVVCDITSANINPKGNIVAFDTNDEVKAVKVYNELCDNGYTPVQIETVVAVQANDIRIIE